MGTKLAHWILPGLRILALWVRILSKALLYVDAIDVPWNKWDVCISVDKIWNKRDYKSLIFSTFEHADDMHLYYNMISFLVKGRTLEYQYGSANFGILLAILSFLTPAIYVLLGLFTAEIFKETSVLSSCAIGFSVPNASFMGHLAGILAGLLYMKTYLGTIVDKIIFNITGKRMLHYRIRWNHGEPRTYHRNGWNSQRNGFFFFFPRFGNDFNNSNY